VRGALYNVVRDVLHDVLRGNSPGQRCDGRDLNRQDRCADFAAPVRVSGGPRVRFAWAERIPGCSDHWPMVYLAAVASLRFF
jgi:hypothetical protein